MQSRWSESEVAQSRCTAEQDTGLAELVYATQLLGRDPALAMHGAGNTSLKQVVHDATGAARSALFVKASGTDLASVTSEDFVVLDHDHLLGLMSAPGAEASFADAAAVCLLRPGARRPSIETPMHSVLPQPIVFHTHPEAVLALCNRRDGAEVVAAALGREVVAVPYAPIGLALGHAIQQALAGAPAARGFVLMYHGLVTWGTTARAAYEATIDMVARAEAYLGRLRVRGLPAAASVPAEERARRYAAVAPAIRSALAASAGQLALDAELGAEVVGVLDTALGRDLGTSAPLTPDCLLRTRRQPLWLERPIFDDAAASGAQWRAALDDYQATYRAWVALRRPAAALAPSSWLPRALMIPGLGVVTAGRDAADARMVRDIVLQSLRVKAAIWESGGIYQSLSEDEMFETEWRLSLQAMVAPGC